VSDWGNFLPNLVDAVLNDGPVAGLAPTKSTQTAILELVQAGVGPLAARPSPSCTWAMTPGDPSCCPISLVLSPAAVGSTPAFRTQSNNSGMALTLVATNPGGIVLGDLMFAYLTCFKLYSDPSGAPAGWRRLCTAFEANSATEFSLWFKYASGSEPGQWNWTLQGGVANFWEAELDVYSGVAGSNAVPTPVLALLQAFWTNGQIPLLGAPTLIGSFPANSRMVCFMKPDGANSPSGNPIVSGGSGVGTVRSPHVFDTVF